MNALTSAKLSASRERIFFIFTAIGLFAFFELGAYGGMNIGFTASYFLIFVLTFIYLYPPRANAAFSLICGAISLLISVSFSLNANPVVKVLAFAAILCLYFLFCGGMSDALIYDLTSFKALLNLFYIPVFMSCIGISEGAKSLSSRKSGKTEGKSGFNLIYLLSGLAISIPILAVVIPLLRSDTAFDIVMGQILVRAGEYIVCVILTLIFLPFLFGMLHKLRHHNGAEKLRYAHKSSGAVNISLLCGVFIMISLVYTIYIIAQFAYLFNSFLGILPEGWSSANYARQGFFEMCTVTVINLFIIFTSFAVCKRKNEDSDVPLAIKIFSGFLCFFDLFMISTAFAKMGIYINRFGLTQKRVAVTVFMAALACVTISLVIRLIKPNFKYIAVSVTVCALILCAYCVADVDRIIANYNIAMFENNKIENLDVSDISRLSDGAIPALYELYVSDCDEDVRAQAKDALLAELCRHSDELEKDNNGINFKNYNLAHKQALDALEKFSKLYDPNKEGILGN